MRRGEVGRSGASRGEQSEQSCRPIEAVHCQWQAGRSVPDLHQFHMIIDLLKEYFGTEVCPLVDKIVERLSKGVQSLNMIILVEES